MPFHLRVPVEQLSVGVSQAHLEKGDASKRARVGKGVLLRRSVLSGLIVRR